MGFFARSRRTTGASKPKLKRLKKKAVKICRRAFARRREKPTVGAAAHQQPDITPPDAEFSHFAASVIDGPAYLAANPDVAAVGRDPLEHWLAHGIAEGRVLAPDVMIRCGVAAERLSGGGWQRFTWRGMPVAARIERIPESILSQIREQTRHDPSIAAAGLRAIAGLNRIDAADLWSRDGTDVARVFASIPSRPSVVMLLPHLVIGGAEKFAADVIEVLQNEGHDILVIVTDQTSQAAGEWTTLRILKPLLNTNVIFWPDVCGPSYQSPMVLARLLNGLRPQYIFVVNSRAGLEMIAAFGRGLSSFARLYCAYFSLGLLGISGVSYGMKYPRRTLRFATAITDNSRVVETSAPGTKACQARAPPCCRHAFILSMKILSMIASHEKAAGQRAISRAVGRGSRASKR